MTKSNLAIGVLVAAVLVAGFALTKPSGIASDNSSLASPAGAVQDSVPNKTVTVTYTNTGFLPQVVTVNRGDSVLFVNASGRALRIASVKDPKDATTSYLGFDASRSISRGESYGVSVSLPGIWGYKNLHDPRTVGIVIVQ